MIKNKSEQKSNKLQILLFNKIGQAKFIKKKEYQWESGAR
jgi:hypothetical protein